MDYLKYAQRVKVNCRQELKEIRRTVSHQIENINTETNYKNKPNRNSRAESTINEI